MRVCSWWRPHGWGNPAGRVGTCLPALHSPWEELGVPRSAPRRRFVFLSSSLCCAPRREWGLGAHTYLEAEHREREPLCDVEMHV